MKFTCEFSENSCWDFDYDYSNSLNQFVKGFTLLSVLAAEMFYFSIYLDHILLLVL